jgi:hypothetical protein
MLLPARLAAPAAAEKAWLQQSTLLKAACNSWLFDAKSGALLLLLLQLT